MLNKIINNKFNSIHTIFLKKTLIIAFIIFPIFELLPAYGAEMNVQTAPSTKQLKTIQYTIQILNKNIEKKHTDELNIEKNLVQTETKISNISKKMIPVTEKLHSQEGQLIKLQSEQERNIKQLQQQKIALEKLIKATYMTHRYNKKDTYLYLMLTQDSVNQLSRFLHYYHYVDQNKTKQISNFHSTLSRLEKNYDQAKIEEKNLQETQKNYQMEDKKLQTFMQSRQMLLEKLRTEIKTDQSRLNQLKKDALNLENTLKELAKKQAQSSERYVNPQARPFNHYRGHMVWPTQGEIIHRFGTPLENSEMTWKGILIAAQPHQRVKAVADGKVLFAEWLRGYGLLIIIDHGQNYLTLYGRNQSLYKKVGEIVKAGESIAQVGQSGGYDKSGLYFEVRYKGLPIDPERWLN